MTHHPRYPEQSKQDTLTSYWRNCFLQYDLIFPSFIPPNSLLSANRPMGGVFQNKRARVGGTRVYSDLRITSFRLILCRSQIGRVAYSKKEGKQEG
jgi:hypothetical protein